jgi:hypothetical protein
LVGRGLRRDAADRPPEACAGAIIFRFIVNVIDDRLAKLVELVALVSGEAHCQPAPLHAMLRRMPPDVEWPIPRTGDPLLMGDVLKK